MRTKTRWQILGPVFVLSYIISFFLVTLIAYFFTGIVLIAGYAFYAEGARNADSFVIVATLIYPGIVALHTYAMIQMTARIAPGRKMAVSIGTGIFICLVLFLGHTVINLFFSDGITEILWYDNTGLFLVGAALLGTFAAIYRFSMIKEPYR